MGSLFILSLSNLSFWPGTPVRRLRSHAGGVRCVCFNEDSSIAISGGRDNAVMCWDIRTRRLDPVQVMKEARDCITAVLTNEHKIYAASLDGCVRHYDIRVGEMTCDKIGEPVTYLAQTRDEQCLVAGCQDSVVRLLDCETGGLLAEYKGHNADDYHIECGILANDAHIVCGSSDGHALVWDLVEGKVLQRIRISKCRGYIPQVTMLSLSFLQVIMAVWCIHWPRTPNDRSCSSPGAGICTYLQRICRLRKSNYRLSVGLR